MEPKEIFNQDNFLKILDLARKIARLPEGQLEDDQRVECKHLAVKLYYHAATIYHLSNGTRVPVSPGTDGDLFYDFASGAVLTRAALETYLTLYEVFLAPVSEDEHQFRYNLWRLAGFAIHEKIKPSDVRQERRTATSQRMNATYRDRICATKKFATLDEGTQNKVLRGIRINSALGTRLREAGLGSNLFSKVYEFHSGYAHSDALSADQVGVAPTKDSQLEHLDVQQGIVMMIVARMIVEYIKMFPEAKPVADAHPSAFALSNILSALADTPG